MNFCSDFISAFFSFHFLGNAYKILRILLQQKYLLSDYLDPVVSVNFPEEEKSRN